MMSKKILILIWIILSCYIVKSQTNSIPSTGPVGIGTVNPIEKLDLRGNMFINSGIDDNHIYWGGHNMTMGTPPGCYAHNIFKLKPEGATQGFLFSVFQMYQANSPTDQQLKIQLHSTGVSFFNGGKVGIGTSSPSDYLQVKSLNYNDIFSIGRVSSTQGNVFDFRITSDPNGVSRLNNRSLTIVAEQAADFGILTDPSQSIPQFIIKKNGNVAIGMQSPEYLLDVAGTIRATEIKVEAQTADFVFEDDYQLKSLEEVDQFVKTNKHLPDIPSAKQMEEDGVGLAEMNKLLLQKVEELTLYTIGLKKSDLEKERKLLTLENELTDIKEYLKINK